MLATLVDEPFDDKKWAFKTKWEDFGAQDAAWASNRKDESLDSVPSLDTVGIINSADGVLHDALAQTARTR